MMGYLYVQITKKSFPTPGNVEIDTNAGKSKVGAVSGQKTNNGLVHIDSNFWQRSIPNNTNEKSKIKQYVCKQTYKKSKKMTK